MKLAPEQYRTRDLLLWVQRATAKPRRPPPSYKQQCLAIQNLVEQPNPLTTADHYCPQEVAKLSLLLLSLSVYLMLTDGNYLGFFSGQEGIVLGLFHTIVAKLLFLGSLQETPRACKYNFNWGTVHFEKSPVVTVAILHPIPNFPDCSTAPYTKRSRKGVLKVYCVYTFPSPQGYLENLLLPLLVHSPCRTHCNDSLYDTRKV